MRAGIIGLGRVGQAHARALQSHGVEIVAVCGGSVDTTRERAQAFGLGHRVCETAKDLAEREDLDVVVIASPHEMHTAHVCMSAKLNRRLVIEKPIAMTHQELAHQGRAIRAANVRSGVAFVWRWIPALQKLWEARAEVGEQRIVSVALWNGQHHGRPTSPREPGTVRGDISTILSSGCHSVDLACWLTQSHVESVRALSTAQAGGVQRTSLLLLRFSSGAVGTISSSDEIFRPITLRMSLSGTRGGIDFDMDGKSARIYSADRTDQYHTLAPIDPVALRAVATLPFNAMIGEFLNDWRMGRDTQVNFAWAQHIHEVCFAAEESARKGGETVYLP